MRSPAAAFAWEFRHRHRWGLIGIGVYVILLAGVKFVVVRRGLPINFDSAESFAFAVVVPLTATFLYFLAMFTYGLAGDVTARQSMFPTRLFTLPVSTAALVRWPMLYGGAAMVLLWFVTRAFALWPSGIPVPVIWPAVLAPALLAWTQALMWMPSPLPGLRVVAAMLCLGTIDSMVLLALQFQASEPVMLAIALPQLPLSYAAARYAVARARRGDVPDWRAALGWLGSFGFRTQRRFATPASAQVWFEWRRYGKSLPILVGILLPLELALLWVTGGVPVLVLEIVLGVLVTPVFMALFVAATVSRSSDSGGLEPFIATRPLSDAALIAAKLQTTIWSTALAWILVLLAIPVALRWSGNGPMVVDRLGRFAASVGTLRATVFLLLVLLGFIAATWKQLVQNMYIGLTGRAWLIKGSVFVALAGIAFIGPTVQWIVDHAYVGRLWSAIPLVLAILAGVKLAAAAWLGTRLHQDGCRDARTLVTGAACWLAAVLALHGVLVWLLDSPHIPSYLTALFAILFVPLTRLPAAPPAVDWDPR